MSRWASFARGCARTAYEDYFSTRWGVWVIDERPGVIVVFSNHFYKNFPKRQGEEIDELKRRFSAAGIEVLGLATYPTSGPSDGYSYAMVVRGREDQESVVASIQDDVVDLMLSRCCEGS
jgi:hypothetical protein